MDALGATAATAATTTTTPSTTPADAAPAAKKSFATLFADAEKDLKSGEKLSRVDGHAFARIKGGDRDEMCVNLSGNGRSGQAFDRVWRDGRCFHVYGGAGADHDVVEVATAKKDAAATGGTTAKT